MSDSPAAPTRHGLFEWLQILSHLAAVVGVIAIFVVYRAERDDTNRLERQQLAAEMFQRKYDDRVMTAYVKVSDAFDSQNKIFPIFAGAQEEGKQELADEIIKTAGLENIKVVVDYYNDLLVCVEKGLCDEDLTRALVDQDIRNFYCKARYVGLPQLRERYSYPTYGKRLETFAKGCDK